MKDLFTHLLPQNRTLAAQSYMVYHPVNWTSYNEFRLITIASKSEHITPILFNLHWLPVKELITFKLILITFKALHGQAPSYISELLNIYQPSCSLKSSSLKYLSVAKCNTVSYGRRAFSVASAKLWNSLPYHLRFTENISTFKTSLKTFLFKRTFNLHQSDVL